MIPLKDDNPSRRPPVVTRTLIAINVGLFAYQITLGPSLRGFMFEWGMVPIRLTAAFEGGPEPLSAPAITLFSSMFLHGGWAHLIGNMWYLWIFGDNVEDRLGRFGFSAFYVIAGIAAGLAHWLSDPGSPLPTVGASGAIAAVLGAYLVAFPRARVLTLVPIIVIFQFMWLPAVIVLSLWFVYQFFSGALSLAGASGGVAWWAHIGGFVFGAAAMKLIGFGGRPRVAPVRVD